MSLPYFKDPIIVDASVTGKRGHVMADRLVIIHLVLTSLAEAPSPTEIVKDLMRAFLEDSSFLYRKVVFDLEDGGAEVYKNTMADLLEELKRYDISILSHKTMSLIFAKIQCPEDGYLSHKSFSRAKWLPLLDGGSLRQCGRGKRVPTVLYVIRLTWS